MYLKNSGNALFLILIAIVLLGGLTALFVRSGSDTEETGSAEGASLAASDVLKYAGGIKAGVDRLVSQGCSESQISFWYDSNGDGTENGSDTYYNASAPTNRSCHLFYPEGAGLTWQNPKDNWVDSAFSAQGLYKTLLFTGSTCLLGNSSSTCDGARTTDEDLILFVPFLRKDVCSAINRALGSSTLYADTASAWTGTPRFTGAFAQADSLGNGTTFIDFKKYCFQGAGTPPAGSYHFYIVLINRI